MAQNATQHTTESKKFPPVISVLGHVDHGKTTLLDAIRKTSIAEREKGGITQGIGASHVEILRDDGKKRSLTLIDTPGHEIFSNMRKHGANVSDIVLLVVAADDGVMPQTKESIQAIFDAKTPCIVVVTKIDMPGARIDRVKQQLAKEKIQLEEYGGTTPLIGVSAKTGQGLKDLLDLIFLVYDFSSLEKDEKQAFSGVVIDARRDARRGVVVSLIVRSGIFSRGDSVFTKSGEQGRARALLDTVLRQTDKAYPGDAVEILGLKQTLPAGSLVFNRKQEVESIRTFDKPAVKPQQSLSALLSADANKGLSIVLKTQSKAEFEAIKNALPPGIGIISEGQGDINASDILLAKDFSAIVVGFNISIEKAAKQLCDSERVVYRIYGIVYELLDELEDVLEHKLDLLSEKILGKATIVASFEGKEGKILGIRISEGRIALGDSVKIIRGEREIGKSKISSLKRGKNDVKEVGKGNECGVGILPQIDFAPSDVLLSYK